MKFAEHLAAHITPEWRKQYLQYDEMKMLIYNAVESKPSDEADKDELARYVESFDEEFFKFCEKELAKINTFYAEKLAEATRKFSNLKNDLDLIKAKFASSFNPATVQATATGKKADGTLLKNIIEVKNAITKEVRSQVRKMHYLKLAFSEFYLSLVLLQNYQNLNSTGFRKILKKHDKLLGNDLGTKWRQAHVETAPSYINKDVDKLIVETENLFTAELECGDRQKAMKRLRVPPLNDKQSPWTTYRVGYFSGAFSVLIAAVILTGVFMETGDDWRIVFRLYRGTFLVILFLFLIGINVYGWRTSGVNHVLIFELDPRDHLSEQHLIEIASIFGVLWSLSVLSYLFSDRIGIPQYVNPLTLVILMVLFLLNPFPTMRHNARFWLLRVLGRIISAPFVKVNFADFWLADQLNSLVPVFLDFEYFICFYLSTDKPGSWYERHDTESCIGSTRRDLIIRTIVSCLPAWFRFAQCLRRYHDDNRGPFPHLVNAGKYSTTFFVVIFSTLTVANQDSFVDSLHNPYFFFWILSMIISSCYTYIWDIKMDWGLFDPEAPKEYQCLREEIVYSSPAYYYFAIVEDLILRFGWTLSVSLTEIGLINSDIMATILGPLEIFRRFIWNFFRLENEHLNNCGEFRAVRDISITPIDAGDQAKIIKMMDDPDGVSNRRSKNTKSKEAKNRPNLSRPKKQDHHRLFLGDGNEKNQVFL